MKHEKDEHDETIIRGEELIGNEWVLEQEPMGNSQPRLVHIRPASGSMNGAKKKYGIVRTTATKNLDVLTL